MLPVTTASFKKQVNKSMQV